MMEHAYDIYDWDAKSLQERSEISSAARQGYNARRNLSKEGYRLFFALAITLLFGACVQDLEGIKQEKTAAEDETALVTLSLNVPTPPTRALDDAAEGAINRIDVLLFKSGDLYYRAGVSGTSISSDANDPNTQKSFTVRLPIGDGYEAVVLANAENTVGGYSSNSIISSGPSRASVINNLAVALTATTRKWTEDFTHIPMWGYLTSLNIGGTSPTQNPSIPLTRAIARIDVSVGEVGSNGDAVRGKFEMEHVYLYNYSRAGSLAPLVSGAGYDATQWDAVNGEAIAPHLPSVTPLLKVEGPLAFLEYSTAGKEHAFTREIYTFEAAKGKTVTTTTTDWKANTCLVIGGSFEGGTETFYRVEFRSSHDPDDGAYDYLALLRNHCYNVVIQEVKSAGYPSKEEAYNNTPTNIVVRIIPWNEGDMGEVEFTGQHYLSVDKSHVDFYAAAATKNIYAATNHPDGWTIEVPSEFASWLSVDPEEYDGLEYEKKQTIKITVTAVDGTVRDGHFFIVVGNLRKKITVSQSLEDEFSFEVSPWEITFYQSQSLPTRVNLFPIPAANAATYPLSFIVSGNVAWDEIRDDTGNDHKADLSGLSSTTAYLDLLPTDYSSGSPLTSTLLASFTETASSRVLTRPIVIRQLSRPMEFRPTLSNPYPAAAGTYRFDVMSEGPWKLSESPSDYDWLELEASEAAPSYHPATSSYPYYFLLTENLDSYLPRTATISVAGDPALPSPWATFEIEQLGTPPYITVTPSMVNFSSTPGAQTVTLSTNAPWQFTTDANYDNVVKSSDLQAGVTHSSSHNIPAPVTPDPTIEFIPEDFVPTSTTGKLSTVVTFTTDVAGVENASTTITLSRYDPRTYMFSPDYSTLTLFPNFERGTYLDGIDDIPEFADDHSIKAKVITLVIEGDVADVFTSDNSIWRAQTNTLTSLTGFSMPDFTGSISYNMFNGATWLERADLPLVTDIRNGTFLQTSLTAVNFPKLETISMNLFFGCKSLTRVDFPLVTSIEYGAFAQCENLSIVNVPLATSIGDQVFESCTSLTRVDFLPLVTSVGHGAFSGCTNLTVVDLPNADYLGIIVFQRCPGNLTLKINSPEQPVSFSWNKSLYCDTFYGVGAPDWNSAGTGTTKMTLYLGKDVKDERGNGRPDNLPQNNIEWGGYYDNGTWVPYTWGRIDKYEDPTPIP